MEILISALYGPIWLSWITTLIGTALTAGPLFLLIRATEALPIAMQWSVREASFGIIVLPLALWLYAQFFTDPVRALFLGVPGLFLLVHFAPFQDAGAVSHAIVENTGPGVLSALRSAVLVGSILWAVVYRSIGFLFAPSSAGDSVATLAPNSRPKTDVENARLKSSLSSSRLSRHPLGQCFVPS